MKDLNAQCDYEFYNSTISTNSANGMASWVGCSEIEICVSFVNFNENPTVGTIPFTLTILTNSNNAVDFTVVDPGPYTQASSTTFTTSITGMGPETPVELCLTLTIDSWNFSLDTYFRTSIVAAPPSCSAIPLSFDNTFPSGLDADIGDDELSNLIGNELLSASNSVTQGQDIVIRERLVIDEPIYTIGNGSEIMMYPDATIEISEGSFLHIVQGANILACSDMWENILVKDGGGLIIDGNTGVNDIIIKDALNAIEIEEGSFVQVDKAKFLNNHRGIHSAFNSGDASIEVSNSDFEVNSEGLRPPMTGATNAQGIVINHQNLTVVLDDNSYNNLSLGVNAQHTNVMSMNETFTNLNAGIYMGSDRLHSLVQSDGFFENVIIGIEGRNINIISSGNEMSGLSHGYRLYNGRARSFDIHDNTINASNFGVLMFNWNAFGVASIADNEINMASPTAPDAAGIRMAGMPHVTGEVVSGNVISTNGVKKGIDFQDCVRIFAVENAITQEDANLYWDGIHIQGGTYVFPYCNYIRGGSSGGFQRGISVDQTPNVRPSCNSLDSTRTGILYAGMGLKADIRANELYEHGVGIQIGTETGMFAGIIGTQPFKGNQWAGTQISGFGLVHTEDDNDIAMLSQFTVNTSGMGNAVFGTTPSPSDLLVVDLSQSNLNCSGGKFGCTSPPDSTLLEDFNEDDCAIAVALDTIVLPDFPDAQRWTGKRQLYRNLMEVADSISYLDECLEDFYNMADTSTVGQFEHIRKDMLELFQPSDGVQQTFDDNYAEWHGMAGELVSVLAGLRDTSTSSQDSIVLEGQRDSLLQEMADVSHIQDSLDQLFQAACVTGATALLSVNTAITATYIWEHNQRNYNRVWLQMVADTLAEPDSNQAATLLYIANQCPFAGGEAVYQARALLGEGYAYDDSTLCAPAVPLIKKKDGTQLDFEVFPNPANGFFTVGLKERTFASGQAVLTDLLGRTIAVQHIAEGTEQFYFIVDHAPAGMYSLTVMVDGKMASRTISIVK